MSANTQLADATVNAQADALARKLDNGWLRIYDGAQPATADTAIGAQVLLAELRFSATSAPAAVSGLLTFNALTADSDANNTGTAAWFRCFSADGTTSVMDGSVGTSNANLIMATVSISQHQTVSCSSFTHDVRNATSGL